MGKNHASQYANFGSLLARHNAHTRICLRNPLHFFRLPTYFIRYLCFQTKVHNHALQLVQSILQE